MTVEQMTIVKETVCNLVETEFARNQVPAQLGVIILDSVTNRFKESAIMASAVQIENMSQQIEEMTRQQNEVPENPENQEVIDPEVPTKE